jgi:hypothetical protein
MANWDRKRLTETARERQDERSSADPSKISSQLMEPGPEGYAQTPFWLSILPHPCHYFPGSKIPTYGMQNDRARFHSPSALLPKTSVSKKNEK